jgi:hypothetical protein
VRFAEQPFYFAYLAEYRNPDYNAEADLPAAGAAPVRANLHKAITLADTQQPDAYIDHDLGMFSTVFSKFDGYIDGTLVTGRGQIPMAPHQAFYQKITRSFLTRSERAKLCGGARDRIRRRSDITLGANNLKTETLAAATGPLHFDSFNPAAAHPLTCVSSADGIWPLSRRDPNLNKLNGRMGQNANPMLPPQTSLEFRFTRHSPRFAYIQTSASRLPDAAALTDTAATDAQKAPDVTILLKKFAILYELLELEQKASLKRELRFYHDAVSVYTQTLTAGVDTAYHEVAIEKGTKLLFVVACYSHQIRFNAGQRKNQVMRFPRLANLASIKFQIGDTPIYTNAALDGLAEGGAANLRTPSSYQMFSYLCQRKMFDEGFDKFRVEADADSNYLGGIFPIDLTTFDPKLLPADLKTTLYFEGGASPANAQLATIAVSEAVWRCVRGENDRREWTYETLAGSGAKKIKLG